MLAPSDFARPRAAIDSDGTVEGYASLFGAIDQARDMVMPGAFEASLRRRPLRRVPMLFQHDPSEPVGVWLELREDVHGLYARGRLIPDVQRSRELLALLREGGIDGLSIGFRTVKGRLDPKTRVRKLHEIDLWEISIVTFPLLAGARLALASPRVLPSAGPRINSASGQREQRHKGAVKGMDAPSSLSPARARGSRPVDPSVQRFVPERLFRRQPRLRFGGGKDNASWRDLFMSERALSSRAGGARDMR